MDRVINDKMTLEFRREEGVEGWRVYMLDDHPLVNIVDSREGGIVAHWNCIDSSSWVSSKVKVSLGGNVQNSMILTLNDSEINGLVSDCKIMAKNLSVGSRCLIRNVNAVSIDYTTSIDRLAFIDSHIISSPLWIAPKSGNTASNYNVEFVDSRVEGRFLISKSLFSIRCSLTGEFVISEQVALVDSNFTGSYIFKKEGKFIENEFSNQDEIVK